MRIKQKHIKIIREKILEKQNYKCCLCNIDMRFWDTSTYCLDHCHVTGNIRGVLCRNCNGCEGKVINLARRCKRSFTSLYWLRSLTEYLQQHQDTPSGVYHPTYKTRDEKRLARNKKARLKHKKGKV